MKRYDIYIDENKIKTLGNLQGTVSEHVRRAIDLYIEKLESTPAGSLSKKVGDSNG